MHLKTAVRSEKLSIFFGLLFLVDTHIYTHFMKLSCY